MSRGVGRPKDAGAGRVELNANGNLDLGDETRGVSRHPNHADFTLPLVPSRPFWRRIHWVRRKAMDMRGNKWAERRHVSCIGRTAASDSIGRVVPYTLRKLNVPC